MRDNDPLKDEHHFTKLVKKTKIHEDGTIDSCELVPRKDEEFMSVDWLEHYGHDDVDKNIEELKQYYNYNFTIRTQKLPLLNVQKVKSHVEENTREKRKLKILYKPENFNPSHSGVYNYKHDDELIGDLIAQKVEKLYEAKINNGL